jgi:hypothetical protein
MKYRQQMWVIAALLLAVSSMQNAYDYTILVLPSGGATGIIPARLLEQIEQEVAAPVYTLFDEIWGCSAGAITASLLVHPMPARSIVQFFEHNFSHYYRAYAVPGAVQTILQRKRLQDALAPVRIVTAAYEGNEKQWIPYDFSSDGAGASRDTTLSLARVVAASCCVYPYLYREPIHIASSDGESRLCIDPASLCCQQPIADPTAYFLSQWLPRLSAEDTMTIYFLANAFIDSLERDEIRHVLSNYAHNRSYAIRDVDGSFSCEVRNQIEIVNVPFFFSAQEMVDRYLKTSSPIAALWVTILRKTVACFVGKDDADANILATGTIPIWELKKSAAYVIHRSENFRMMVRDLKQKVATRT